MAKLATKVAGRIRKQIVLGELKPGSRLPNRDVLIRQYDVSIAILQDSIAQLVNEGFLEVGPRKLGTRVVATPPHLHHYKIVFPVKRDLPRGIWKALRDCAEAINEDPQDDRSFSFFYTLSEHREIESYQSVVEEVLNNRVAGLILASGAHEFRGTPILEHPGVPRAAIAGRDELKGIPKVLLDYGSFFDLALDHLKAQGCRNIAVLAASPIFADNIQAAFAKHELPLPDTNLQFPVSHPMPELNAAPIANLARLLMQQRPAPDGFLLMGEHIPGNALAVVDPGKIPIVSLANFPTETPHPRIRRFGFSISRLLETLVHLIDEQKSGTTTPEFTTLPAVPEP